jgi:acid phosphatase
MKMKLGYAVVFCWIALLVQSGCGGGSSSTSSSSTSASLTSTVPHFMHVFIVVEENHSYGSVIGNPSMPYLNGLAKANGLATQYFADAHPSLPNYFELTLGEGTSITTIFGDSYTGPVSQDNVVRALTNAGKTWKTYQEGIPSVGYLGSDSGAYLQRHNPFRYFSDVQNSTSQASNIVPFTQFATDLAASNLPDYSFIVPDVNNNAHDCPAGMSSCTDTQKLAAADQWLSTNIAPLIASSAFQNSLLIIVFDEGDLSDLQYGGGQVAAVIVSPLAKPGYQSTTHYEHASSLRLMLKGLGVTDLPGASATAADMGEFFK